MCRLFLNFEVAYIFSFGKSTQYSCSRCCVFRGINFWWFNREVLICTIQRKGCWEKFNLMWLFIKHHPFKATMCYNITKLHRTAGNLQCLRNGTTRTHTVTYISLEAILWLDLNWSHIIHLAVPASNWFGQRPVFVLDWDI